MVFIKNKFGFSLIEVLVFVTILGLFFVAAVSVTTFSLKNMKINEHKIVATHFAEEGLEWIKSEKEGDWGVFIGKDTSSGSGTSYCLNDLNWSTIGNCGEVYPLGTPSSFKREVTLKNINTPTSEVDIEIIVNWIEGNQTMNIPIKSVVNLWE